MAGLLCFLRCSHFRAEVEAAVAAEGWSDVMVAAYDARCGRPPVSWDELRPLVAGGCTQVVVFGRACLGELGEPPEGWPPVRQVRPGQCFELVAGATLVAEALARGAYLVTPGWLDDWRGHLRGLGFSERNAAALFQEFAQELVLLDTGVLADAAPKLAELADVVGLPATRTAVGIDTTRLTLARLVAEWRMEEERRGAEQQAKTHARERADHVTAMDFLGRLAVLADEEQAIAAIKELFRMLFAPERLHYLRFDGGRFQPDEAVPSDLRAQLLALDGDWAWTGSGTGFVLRIRVGEESLGAVVADRFAFPEFRDRYLNMALSVAGVCGLAIENARTYRRMKDIEEALRKSERSLALAQSIAHLGHWEWNVSTDDLTWSDETYRILGYTPRAVVPSRQTFLAVIHPDDRELVESAMRAARTRGPFDIEYRVLLAGGGVRVVRGLGEVVTLGAGRQELILGTLRDVTRPEPLEVLGVIQDITDRKELELRLEQEARTDPLTGCANRRFFLQRAMQELGRVRRYGGAMSVFIVDLDHFKAVNDTYGHHVGDATLRALVQLASATLREEDVTGRLGGEEFGVLLPETVHEKAFEVAERLRRAIASAEVPRDDGPPIRFTASIGIATLEPGDVGVDSVLDRADRALYVAKGTGRNRVVPYGATPAPSVE